MDNVGILRLPVLLFRARHVTPAASSRRRRVSQLLPKVTVRSTHLHAPAACLAVALILSGPPAKAADEGADLRLLLGQVPDVTLHVDCSSRSTDETRDGSAAKPYRTLSEAKPHAQRLLGEGQSVRVLFQPGVYRESVHWVTPADNTAERDAILILVADKPGSVVFSGAATEGFEAATWRPTPEAPGVFEHAWDEDLGAREGPWANSAGAVLDGLGARRELVVLDGRRLDQVELEVYRWSDPDGAAGFGDHVVAEVGNQPGKLAYEGVSSRGLEVLDRPWSFAVASRDDSPPHLRNRLFVRLPEGRTIDDVSKIEVAVPLADAEQGDTFFSFDGKSNVALIGLTFRHAGTFALGSALRFTNATNVLLDDCEFLHNGGAGVSIGAWEQSDCRAFTLRRCRFLHNGYNGMKLQVQGCLVDKTVIAFGNWRGALGRFFSWDAAAVKTVLSRDVTFRNCVAIGNQSNGYWNDIDNIRTVYESCLALGNRGNGFFVELARGDTGHDAVRRCVSAYNGVGIVAANVRHADIRDNLLVDNETQFQFSDYENRPPKTADEIGRLTFFDNRLIDTRSSPRFVELNDGGPSVTSAERFATLSSDRNRYEGATDEAGFLIGERRFNLNDWRSMLVGRGNELNSEESSRFVETTEANTGFHSEDSPLVQDAAVRGVRVPIELVQEHRRLEELQRGDLERSLRLRLAQRWALTRGGDGLPVWRRLPLEEFGNYHPSDNYETVRLDPQDLAGLTEFFGVPMSVTFNARGGVAFASAREPNLPASVDVPIDGRGQAVYVLHAACYAARSETFGGYSLVYENGETHHVELFSPGSAAAGAASYNPGLLQRATVQDWWRDFRPVENAQLKPFPLTSIVVGGDIVGENLYQLQIANPHPERRIKSLRIETDPAKEASLIVFATTLLE